MHARDVEHVKIQIWEAQKRMLLKFNKRKHQQMYSITIILFFV